MPTTRQQTDASCVLLRSRMPNTRFAKFLCELGCSRTTPAKPHITASLCQEVTLWSCVLSQCCRRMPNTFCACQVLILQPHQMHFCHTLRRTSVVPCTSRHEDAPESVVHVSIAHLSRPILEAVQSRPAITLLLSLEGSKRQCNR